VDIPKVLSFNYLKLSQFSAFISFRVLRAIPAFALSFVFSVGVATPLLALTPLQIAEKAQHKDQDNLKKYGARPCRLVEIKEELNEKGAVEKREEKTIQMAASSVPIPGGRETQRISPEIHAKNPKEDSSILDHLGLFDWKLEGEDESQGEPCYRLAFTPKKGAKAMGGREAVMARTRGRCWVAKRDFSKIRLEGRLQKPVEVMGFLVTVREVDFITTTHRIAEGVAAPRQVRYRFRVEVFPLFEFHERHTQRFDFTPQAKSWASPQNQKGGVAGLK